MRSSSTSLCSISYLRSAVRSFIWFRTADPKKLNPKEESVLWPSMKERQDSRFLDDITFDFSLLRLLSSYRIYFQVLNFFIFPEGHQEVASDSFCFLSIFWCNLFFLYRLSDTSLTIRNSRRKKRKEYRKREQDITPDIILLKISVSITGVIFFFYHSFIWCILVLVFYVMHQM